MASGTAGRPNQRTRTRKAMLDAAARLAGQGRTPTLEDVAAEALVSRATAYRYFPSIEALMIEASLHIAFPDADTLFADGLADPSARIARAERAVHEMVVSHEGALRMMLAHSVTMVMREGAAREGSTREGGAPVRQNRRTPLIEAALAPGRSRMDEATFARLSHALALIIGTESMIVCKDVLGIEADEAEAVKLWAIEALMRAAMDRR